MLETTRGGLLALGLAALPAATTPASAETEANPSRERVDEEVDLRELEPRLQRLVDRTAPAVVRITRLGREASTASGVIFDPAGLVLTAGHAATGREARFVVDLPDGRSYRAASVGSVFEGDLDLAVLRLDTSRDADADEPLPWLPLAPAGTISRSEWVVALGYAAVISPGRVGDPAARIGRVLAVDRASLAMDSTIDAGDSGGPIIDLEGRVIGISSRCGSEAWQNLATTVDAAHAWMPHLLDAESPAPDLADWSGRVGRRSPAGSKRDPRLLSTLGAFTERTDGLIVEIRSDDRLVAHATVIGPDRVITKASTLARHAPDPQVVQRLEGRRRVVPATPIALDPELDLVVLEAPGIAPPIIRPRGRTRAVEAGTVVVVPDESAEATAFGIVARDADELPVDDTPDDRPFLGVATRSAREGGLRIGTVVPNSAAALAGLQVGDRLLRVGDLEVVGPSDLPEVLSKHAFGDPIRLEIAREDRVLGVELRLGLRPDGSRQLLPGNTSTGTSRLSSGFGPVHLVDADRPLHAVGGAAVDLDGRLLGWIAARRARTSLVLVPWDRIESSLAELPIDPKSAELRLCSYRVVATEASRGIQLAAEDARPDGTDLRRERLGDGGRTTWGEWTTSTDALEWTAVIDEPGRFLVSVKTACPGRRAGTPMRFRLGQARVDGRIEGTDGWSDFQWHDFGVIEATETGTLVARFEALGRPREEVCKLERIRLVRLRDEAGVEDPPAGRD